MFDLNDLLNGTLNHFKDTLSGHSGDSRRESGIQFLNASLRSYFGVDTLRDVTGFYGIVVSGKESYQETSAQKAQLLKTQAKGEYASEMSQAYKVYIPEIEPSPIPEAEDDPVLWFYPDVWPTWEVNLRDTLTVGTLVRVEYQDLENLIEPRIVSVEGHIDLAIPAVRSGGLPFKFKTIESTPGGIGGDPGRFSWSNRKKQLSATYTVNGRTYNLRNGDIPKELLISHKSGALLLPDALKDFEKMNAAFKKKFGKDLRVHDAYRPYDNQVSARNRRVSGDEHRCHEKPDAKPANNGVVGEGAGQYTYDGTDCQWIGYAAVPGTSNHGWGGAVDILGSTGGAEFKWLNKFGKEKFNFVFGVKGEKWHMAWTGLGSVLNPPVKKGMTRVFTKKEHGIGDDTVTLEPDKAPAQT